MNIKISISLRIINFQKLTKLKQQPIYNINILIQMFNTSQPIRMTNLKPFASLKSQEPSTSNVGWNIDSLESTMRKGVRKQLKVEQLKEQAKIFFNTQKEVIRNKAIVMASLSLALFYILNIEAPTIFAILILLSAQLICTAILPFSDSYLLGNLRKIQPLIYCAIFYSLFKWAVDIMNREINWSIIVISIIATLARYTLQAYSSFFLIQSRSNLASAILQKSIIGSFRNFAKFLGKKIGLIVRMSKHLVVFLGIALTLSVMVLTYLDKFTIEILQLNYIFIALALFAFLEVYLDVIDYLNLEMGQSDKLKTIIKDQMPVFITLLKLQNTASNRMIQLDCLKYVLLKSAQIENYLTTQTCKSLLYNTYMDIFNQYALGELTRTNKIMKELALNIKANDKQVCQYANVLMDLFVYFKKLAAYISSEWAVLKLVSLVSSLSFILLILKDLNLSKQQETQLSRKIFTMSKTIVQRIKECSTSASLSCFTCSQLERVHRKLSDCQQ